MEKRIRINALLDFYGVLLTSKQQEVCRFYYREDLSYSEIAELESTTRTAVYETVKRCISTLEAYESKLHLLEKNTKRMELYEKIKKQTDDAGIRKLVDQCIDTEI